METLLRHWNLLRLIPRCPRKITADAVTAQLDNLGFKTTLRTVQRDLNSLSRYFPIGCDDKRPSGWFWGKHSEPFDIPGLDPHSALTFLLARDFLSPMLPPECLHSLEPQFRCAERILKEMQSGVGSWRDKIEVVSRTQPLLPPVISDAVMNQVCAALLQEKRLALRYRRRGERDLRDYEINPLGLVFSSQIAYLIGTASPSSDPKLFALHRIERAETLGQSFQRPEDFNLQQFTRSGAFGFLLSDRKIALRLRFHDPLPASHLQETPLAENQVFLPCEDGTVVVEATVLDTARLRWWILGFGEQLEVLAPIELRREIGEKCRKAALAYQCDVTVVS